MNSRLPRILMMIAAAGLTHCTEPGEEDGRYLVQTITTGGDVDTDGYLVSVGDREYAAQPNGQIEVDLPPGEHRFELRGVADNCDVVTAGKRQASGVTGGRTRVIYEVNCVRTGIEIRTSIEGIDLDRWFEIYLDNSLRLEPAKLNDAAFLTRLSPGTYTLRLGSEPNCQLEPATRTVVVELRKVSEVRFTGTCVAATGVVHARVEQSGEDLDLSGFAISVDGRTIAGQGNDVFVPEIQPGNHAIQLRSIAANCAVTGPDLSNVLVKAGGPTRDTVSVNFTVSCARMWGIALTRDNSVALASREGQVLDLLGSGGHAAWSPDGGRLAYACFRLCVADLSTGKVEMFAGNMSVSDLSWSPDGRHVVLTDGLCQVEWGDPCSFRGLVFVTPGTGDIRTVPLPPSVRWVTNVAWSPDGSRIAFDCFMTTSDHNRICLIGPDGNDFVQLTTGSADTHDFSPSWSPDGSQLVLVTTRFGEQEIVIMGADGRGMTRLATPTPGAYPAWLADNRILYSSSAAGREGLVLINLDGSGAIRVTRQAGDGPGRWRPEAPPRISGPVR